MFSGIDAFVEVKFADYDVFRTQIARRTLNPVWNEDFRFVRHSVWPFSFREVDLQDGPQEVSDDSTLQNEPLELRILD